MQWQILKETIDVSCSNGNQNLSVQYFVYLELGYTGPSCQVQ